MNRTRPQRRGRPVARGFTLLEMLVVMVLLSLLMVGMGGALRSIGQAGERIDLRLARSDDFRVATSFLRSTLGQVSGRRVFAPDQPGLPAVLFAGAADAVAWVGVMPARYGAGGRSFFRLAVEPVAGRAALVIRFLPWVDAPVFPDWSHAQARTLVPDITAFSIRYEDAREMPPLWLPGWPRTDRTPDRLTLQIVTEQAGAWPALVIPLRVMPQGDPNQGGFVIGGTTN